VAGFVSVIVILASVSGARSVCLGHRIGQSGSTPKGYGMTTLIRLSLIAALCAHLAGCAPFLLVGNPYGFAQMMRESQKYEEMCQNLASINIAVSEVRDLGIPADEGQVSTFEPTGWHVESALTGPTWGERLPAIVLGGNNVAKSIAGTLVITERSVLFLPSEGTTGVRIPFPPVFFTYQRFNLMGEPRAMVIETCNRRLDVFTIWQRDGSQKPDPGANAQALDQIDTRVHADPVRTELRTKIMHELYGSPFR
jgi:hypothetical protein